MNGFRMKPIWQGVRAAGPYLLLELLMPGGTLLAIALWLVQKWRAAAASRGTAEKSREPRACDRLALGLAHCSCAGPKP